jgi:hypothetical protein
MIRHAIHIARDVRSYWALPKAARAAHRADRAGIPSSEPAIDLAQDEAVGWLCRAQDSSRTLDGGVACHFSLIHGWGPSYPETTGYIVPTLLDYARRRNSEEVWVRARRMLDWLISIQFDNGAFQGGTIDARPLVPVVFNTGQILLGLARGVKEFGEAYRVPMRRAADWLAGMQDPDGCWRRGGSPFAMPGEKTYDLHAAWGLFEAARLEPQAGYFEAAMANVRWALSRQHDNGWFDDCCLTDPSQPLTHTLGYALRGLLEAYRFSKDPRLLASSRSAADGLLSAMRPDGFLPGRLDSHWRGSVKWACLTGTAQIAWCWLDLYVETGEARYRNAALSANRFLRHTIHTDGSPVIRGGIKGSFPISGSYAPYEYLNWAAKFFIDAQIFEQDVTAHGTNTRDAGNYL